MRLLGKILDSKNSEATEAAAKNLEVLARYVEAVGPAQTSASPTIRPEPSGQESGVSVRRLKPRSPSSSG